MIDNRFSKLLMVAVFLCVGLTMTAQGHLLFDGIPINGSYPAFLKNLQAAKYKYVSDYEETSFPTIWGKSKDLGGYEAGLYVSYKDDRSQLVTGVSAVVYEKDASLLSMKYEVVRDYLRKVYLSATFQETRYVYDEEPMMERTDRIGILSIPGKGTITLSEGLDMDDNHVLVADYRDGINSAGMRSADAVLASYDLSSFVTCATGCILTEKASKVEIQGQCGGRTFMIEPVDKDKQLLLELMAYQNNNDVKASLLNAYVYSVIRNKVAANTCVVTSGRMERVIYAYVDAQRKAREQKRPTARGVLWGMLKDYLFTSQEKAMIDKTLSKETQERIFSGILGAVGGSGPTNFDMLSPAQQAVIDSSSNGK